MQNTLEFSRKTAPVLREPEAEDGADIWALVRDCKPLDENSMYCNLIQCDHFSDTCIVAELDGEIVGWISAYIPPSNPDTLFIWQVAVSSKARGMGLGSKMLNGLLRRRACAKVTQLQTTITGDNAASWGLFRKFADTHGGDLDAEPHFTKKDHFRGKHDTENMVTIDLAERMRKAA
ncbi:MAG: diaminobutyrate acetyltransferase [Pseudopelagicola sp.]|nr:diaminobutyrate acetyltransferase [Pseudopelagicola sp.]